MSLQYNHLATPANYVEMFAGHAVRTGRQKAAAGARCCLCQGHRRVDPGRKAGPKAGGNRTAARCGMPAHTPMQDASTPNTLAARVVYQRPVIRGHHDEIITNHKMQAIRRTEWCFQ